MERKLARIEVITALTPIPSADRIECASILGWNVVVKKGEFQPGDKCVYFEIDSILPKAPWSEFLVDQPIRLKTKKLRGVISQGLALPLSLFCAMSQYEVGTDVTDMLGVTKYEPPWNGGDLEARSLRPGWIPKTDEERIQNIPEVLDEINQNPLNQNGLTWNQMYATVKMDGSSMTIARRDGELFVCSRNMRLDVDRENRFTMLAKKYATQIPDGFIVQGEACGPGFNGNRMGFKEPLWLVFNVMTIQGNRLSMNDMLAFCEEHELTTVPMVPIPAGLKTVQDVLEYAAGFKYVNDHPAEGLVLRSFDQTVSFKAISNQYLLKTEG